MTMRDQTLPYKEIFVAHCSWNVTVSFPKKKATIEITYPTARRLLRLLPTRSKALLTQTSSGSLIPPTKPATNPPANVSPAPVVLIISSGLITGGV